MDLFEPIKFFARAGVAKDVELEIRIRMGLNVIPLPREEAICARRLAHIGLYPTKRVPSQSSHTPWRTSLWSMDSEGETATLEWRIDWQADRGLPGLSPLINGRDLAAESEGFGLHPWTLMPSTGTPAHPIAANHLWAVHPEPSRVLVLRCTCGDLGCSPQWVTISAADDHVLWDLHETRLAPPTRYAFERETYDTALTHMLTDHNWETPSHRLGRLVRIALSQDDTADAHIHWEGAAVRRDGDVIVAATRGTRTEALRVAAPQDHETIDQAHARATAIADELRRNLDQPEPENYPRLSTL
ncbi:hypothetical protein [Mariniluteicoccus flavus]